MEGKREHGEEERTKVTKVTQKQKTKKGRPLQERCGGRTNTKNEEEKKGKEENGEKMGKLG